MGPPQNVPTRDAKATENAVSVALVYLDAHATTAGVGRQQSCKYGGAVVRRAVVDEDDLNALLCTEGLAALKQERQVVCFVIAGDDERELHIVPPSRAPTKTKCFMPKKFKVAESPVAMTKAAWIR